MKKYVKLSLTDRNTEELLTLGDNVVTGMNGNTTFPSPPVAPANLKLAVTDLRTAYNKAADNRGKKDFADVRLLTAIVEDMLWQLGVYVDMIANGSETVIFSAGMPTSKNHEKSPAPKQVEKFVAKFTGIPGSVLIQWKRPQYAKYFRIYMSTDPVNGQWQLVDTISTRKMMVQNLASGKKFYFKVVAVGTAGVSPDSEIAQAMAA